MLIGITIMILTMLTLFSLILGEDLISGLVNVAIDNDALVDGQSSTFVVAGQDILFTIDTTSLIIAGITLLFAIIAIATITGITVLGSGLNPQSSKIIIMITGFIGIWSILSILAFNLIVDIEIFGSIIYISLTIGYTIGVVQKITGSEN